MRLTPGDHYKIARVALEAALAQLTDELDDGERDTIVDLAAEIATRRGADHDIEALFRAEDEIVEVVADYRKHVRGQIEQLLEELKNDARS